MFNQIVLQGRFTADTELRYTQNNKAVAAFTLACERDIKSADGTRATDFIEGVAFGNTAEFINKFFRKGNMAIVSGRVQRREWTANDGGKRYAFEVVVNTVNFCEAKKATDTSGPVFTEPTADEEEEHLPF